MIYILALVLAIPTYGISIILLIVYLSIKEKPWQIKESMEQAIIDSADKYITSYYANKDNIDDDSTQVSLNLKYLSAFAYLSEYASKIEQDVGVVKFTISINNKIYKGRLVNFSNIARLTARRYFKEPTDSERKANNYLEFDTVTGDWGSLDDISIEEDREPVQHNITEPLVITIITVNKTGEYSVSSLEEGPDSDEKSISGLVGTVLARMDFYPEMKVIIKGHIGSVHNLTTNLISSLNSSHLSSDYFFNSNYYYYLTSNIDEATQDGDKILSFTLNRTSESVNWVDSLYYWQDEWGLECFPEDKNKLSDLKALRFESISYFQIGYHVSKLPKEIGNLTNLEVLILVNVVHEEIVLTRLTELPKEIGNLTKLKYLYAQFNRLSKLPKEIGYLYSLIELKLGGNGISSLPKAIGNLSKLKLLTLWSNSLKSIPVEIGQLTQLEGLDLSGNPLTELPKEIVNLTNLKTLYLPDVKLSTIQKKWIEELKEYDCEVVIH